MDLALNNLQSLICHKTQQTNPNQISTTTKNSSSNFKETPNSNLKENETTKLHKVMIANPCTSTESALIYLLIISSTLCYLTYKVNLHWSILEFLQHSNFFKTYLEIIKLFFISMVNIINLLCTEKLSITNKYFFTANFLIYHKKTINITLSPKNYNMMQYLISVKFTSVNVRGEYYKFPYFFRIGI